MLHENARRDPPQATCVVQTAESAHRHGLLSRLDTFCFMDSYRKLLADKHNIVDLVCCILLSSPCFDPPFEVKRNLVRNLRLAVSVDSLV